MQKEIYEKLLGVLKHHIIPLADPKFSTQADYSILLDKIGDSRIVMIGEATHGTAEFYQSRIDITKKLIEEKGFMAIAIEGDWPDAYAIHRYVQGKGERGDWRQALEEFKRFPTWMWSNNTIPGFMQWLRQFNERLPKSENVGFYGLDLYSLFHSIQAVISYLMQVDPEGAQKARKHYACFDHCKIDPQMYGYLTKIGVKKSCVNDVIKVILDLQRHAFDYLHHDGLSAEEEYFFALQNARLVKDAENYYRCMFAGRVSSWNIRDRHMADTVNVLIDFLEEKRQKPAKIVIWAHNSHLGDARATEMHEQGEVNLGQLLREQYTNHAYSIGFSTFKGFVTAALDWDAPAMRMRLSPGLEGSYEHLFHDLDTKNFLLDLHQHELEHYLQLPRLQRAVGVIYRPEAERLSHYFFTHLLYQFDSLIHYDETEAVEPIRGEIKAAV